jgi:probable phosphoglycerate mutase
MPVKLYLMRHGETEWSLSGQHTGITDIPLTGNGEDEARRLGQRLSGIHFSAALSSPRQRAQRTCELAGLGALAQVEPDLAEWDYGDYEGIRTPEILRKRPGWNIFADGCPNGELPDQVAARADRLIQKLEVLEGNVALISHGHFSRVLAARWIGSPVNQRAAAHARYRHPQHSAGRPETP